MAEYIEREAFIEAVKDIPMWGSVAAMFADGIPTADVAPVVHGRWIALHDEFCTCSICKYPVYLMWDQTNYCQNCGAKMDGGADR